MDRGVIAAPAIIRPIAQGFMMERGISAEELRFYILYWDRIVIPDNNFFSVGVPGEDELLACEAISRPRVSFQGSYQGDQVTNAILSCQSVVAKELVKDKDVDWVLHQIGDSLAVLDDFACEKNAIRVSLANALPVPSGKINFQEILEFKQLRLDELSELHSSLDELYFEILSSSDQDLMSKTVISRLQRSIQNLGTVSNEKFEKTTKYDLSAELNLSGNDIIKGASAGALFGLFSNELAISLTAAVGAVIPLIKIKAKAGVTFEPAKENQKLVYLSCASKEGILEN
jgi:hypothetical protein